MLHHIHNLRQLRFRCVPHHKQGAVFHSNGGGLADEFVADPDGETVGEGDLFYRETNIPQGHALCLSIHGEYGQSAVAFEAIKRVYKQLQK